MFDLFFLFFVSFILSVCTIFLFQKIFYRYGILDNPQKYGKKRKPIPYSMGIVFFLVFAPLASIFIDINLKLELILLFGALITILSFWDDMISLSPKLRLVVQIGIGAIIAITSIKIGYVSNIFGGVIDLYDLNFSIFGKHVYIIPFVFTIFWYVFVFNALNWTDGIQGNTSGLSIICFFVLFLLGMKLYVTDTYIGGRENALFIMKLSIILVGILIPFFYFDVREKILMGDSGTMFLGFMLATLAIISGGKIATVLAVFGIYAVDAIYVIFRRILAGKNPLQGDFSHLHHRLLDIGLKRKHVLITIFSLSFFFGITSLFLDKAGKIGVFVVIAFFVISLSFLGEKVKKITFKK